MGPGIFGTVAGAMAKVGHKILFLNASSASCPATASLPLQSRRAGAEHPLCQTAGIRFRLRPQGVRKTSGRAGVDRLRLGTGGISSPVLGIDRPFCGRHEVPCASCALDKASCALRIRVLLEGCYVEGNTPLNSRRRSTPAVSLKPFYEIANSHWNAISSRHASRLRSSASMLAPSSALQPASSTQTTSSQPIKSSPRGSITPFEWALFTTHATRPGDQGAPEQ